MSSSRASSPPKEARAAPHSPARPHRLRIGGRRVRTRTLVAACLAVAFLVYAYMGGFNHGISGLGWPASGGGTPAAEYREPPRRRRALEAPAVPKSDWLGFLKTGKVSPEARNRLNPNSEDRWRVVHVEKARERKLGSAHGHTPSRSLWNPLSWPSRLFGFGGGQSANELDDFALIDPSWTTSHLHPFPDGDGVDADTEDDAGAGPDTSPADADPEVDEPSWLDWRGLDDAEAEERAQAGIVGALPYEPGDRSVREIARWRKYRASDEQRLAALTGLVPSDPDLALSDIGKNDFKELGRRMREFFLLRRRHAEVYMHLRKVHGITDPWAWRPNHPSSPMPKFPPADQLTGPLPTDPDNPTSPLNPRANEPYAHPEITPRTLDYARRFLRAYEAKLFPFLRPTFSSLSALHKSSRAGGRGIVMSAGDPQLRACMVSIRTIREKMGSRLPIEIWYSGPGDLSDWGASRFKRWGAVTVRDIRHLFDHEVADLGGWAIKPFAVLGSSFREVIFVDADVVFMQPPDNLFHHQLYLDTGALFFRDRHNLFPDSKGHGDWLRSVMPRPPSDTIRQRKMYMGKGQHEMESGVMAIDRWRHLEGLVAAAKLMSKEWREGSGKWALGDKELFWMGFELVADTSYSMHPARSGVLGVLIPRHLPGGATVFRMGKNASYRPDAGWHPTPEDRGKICGIQLAHPTDPLFFAAGPRYGNDPESDSEEGEPGFNFTRPAGNVSRDPLEDKVRTYRSRRKDRLEALRKANETVDPAFRLERIPKEQPWIMWFNGGLQTDKFHGDLWPHGDAALARMEDWIDEPDEGDWEISDANVFCVHVGRGKGWRRPKKLRRSERELLLWVQRVYVELEAGADQPEDF